MESLYENVVRLSENGERENEIERLRKKFKFFNPPNNMLNIPNSNVSTPTGSNNIKISKTSNNFEVKSSNGLLTSSGMSIGIKSNFPNPKSKQIRHTQQLNMRNDKDNEISRNSNINNNISNTKTSSFHLKSNVNLPVNINNVVNIVNNNYNNIINAPGTISASNLNNVSIISSYGSLSKENDTERQSFGKPTQNNLDSQKRFPALLEDAFGNITQNTEESFNLRDVQNYYEGMQIKVGVDSMRSKGEGEGEGEGDGEDQAYYETRLGNSKNNYFPNNNNNNFPIAFTHNNRNSGLQSFQLGNTNNTNDKFLGTSQFKNEDDDATDEKLNERSNVNYNNNNHSLINYSNNPALNSNRFYNNNEYGAYPKKNNIFIKTATCNLSNRFINDESRHHLLSLNTNYKFIEKIREDKLKQQSLNSKSFWRLNDNAMYVLLSFMYNQFDDLMKANQSFAKRICLSFNNKFEGIVRVFSEKYKEVLELQEFYFKQTNFRKGRSIVTVIDLVLKSKIITSKVNQCVEISFTYKIDNKEYIQTWKLDIKKKVDIGFWFASEAEEYNQSIIRYCYFQPIVSYCKDDYVEFRVNICSKSGILDTDSAQWLDPIIFNTPEHTFLDYEKSLVKSNVKFDRIRYCELENVIHVWKNEKSLTKKQNIEEFKKYFHNNFKILSVDYDFSKFYIFKVKMQANAIGCVKKNKFTNVDIEIKPYVDNLTNETQCLGILNINHLTKKVELRISSYVIFYFTDLYL